MKNTAFKRKFAVEFLVSMDYVHHRTGQHRFDQV